MLISLFVSFLATSRTTSKGIAPNNMLVYHWSISNSISVLDFTKPIPNAER
jgi:hypothetical protein